MSEQVQEQAPQEQSQEQGSQEQSFDVRLVKRYTGAMHNVTGQGLQPVVHGETGEPESEYALVANVEGVDVTLGSYNAGRLETLIQSEQSRQQAQPSGS